MRRETVILVILAFIGTSVVSVHPTTPQPTTVLPFTRPPPTFPPFTEMKVHPCARDMNFNGKCVEKNGPPPRRPDILTCTSTGDPHFYPFHGGYFSFQGTGKYLLAGYDDPNKPQCKISVEVMHEYRRGNKKISWNRYVEVKLHNSGVTIKLDKRSNWGQPPPLFVNGGSQNAPYNGNNHGSPEFNVAGTVGILAISVTACPLFYVSFDGWRTVRVRVSRNFRRHLSGMCTESNGESASMWVVRDNSTDAMEITPPAIPGRRRRSVDDICSDKQRGPAESKCNLIFDVFVGLTQEGAHIQTTFNFCVYDVCNDFNEENDPDPTVCAYLEDINDWLLRNGYAPVAYHENPLANCPLECGVNAEYMYGRPCPRTCQHDPGMPVPCSKPAIWVCLCKNGFVLSGGECVLPSDCGCTTSDGRYYKPGEAYVRSDCKKKYTCEVTKGSRKFKEESLGKCNNKAECKVNPESGQRECICYPGLVGDGRIKCEHPEDPQDPQDTCERLNPCKNGGTCTNKKYGGFECCCSEGWTGPTCEEKELPPKPPGPHSECIRDDDPKGLMYFGTKSTTTSGRKCQPWASRYPHEHAYHTVLAKEENYCRNRLHGIKGLYGPWCYTMDPNKKWEYCDTIPKCSKPNMTFPEPPENPGCYMRSDKGESYEGPVWFAANGKRCKKWYNYPDNNCRNPGAVRNKPWCWTRDGKEDCDIDICALPPPVPGEDACTVDTSVSVCKSTIKLNGDCYFRHRLYEECDFTVVTISSIIYDIYMPSVTKELHWRGIGGQERYTSHTCRVTFEVSDFNELTIKFPICGWCATKTFRSFMNDVNSGTKTCPAP